MTKSTRIFLDSPNPDETQEVLLKVGSLDGQTTNPSYLAQSPKTKERLNTKGKFSVDELLEFYKKTVQDISKQIPGKSVSIEVYADKDVTADRMLEQAREMNSWISSAHIKLPMIPEGLKAAELAVKESIRVNMTLVFSQVQAAAAYSATRGAKKGDVLLSPFISRLDKLGLNGLDLIKNILRMYQAGDGHVEVLASSIHSTDVMRRLVEMGVDFMTVPSDSLLDYKDQKFDKHDMGNLDQIVFEKYDLNADWHTFNIQHDLTDQGLEKFAKDWNDLLN